MNLLWTVVYLINILSYQKYSNDIVKDGHVALFQISRRVGSGKLIDNKTFIASHKQDTGIYHFDDKRFLSLNDMLYYILFF